MWQLETCNGMVLHRLFFCSRSSISCISLSAVTGSIAEKPQLPGPEAICGAEESTAVVGWFCSSDVVRFCIPTVTVWEQTWKTGLLHELEGKFVQEMADQRSSTEDGRCFVHFVLNLISFVWFCTHIVSYGTYWIRLVLTSSCCVVWHYSKASQWHPVGSHISWKRRSCSTATVWCLVDLVWAAQITNESHQGKVFLVTAVHNLI